MKTSTIVALIAAALIGNTVNQTTIEEVSAPVVEPIPVTIIEEEEHPEIIETVSPEEMLRQSWQDDYDMYIMRMKYADSSDERMSIFIEFKQFLNDNEDIVDPPEDLEMCFSDESLNILYSVVETEVHGGDFDSKVHVANVIFNRFVSEDWPNDLTKVLTAANQFGHANHTIDESTILACEFAWLIPFDETENSTFFHSGEYTSTFSGGDYVMTDDVGHHFYNKED